MVYDVSVCNGVASWQQRGSVISTNKVMQYTGLRDRDNEEVYEGDIVYHESLAAARIYCVVWDYLSGALVLRCILDDGLFADTSVLRYATVIGNIYLNPGLCK